MACLLLVILVLGFQLRSSAQGTQPSYGPPAATFGGGFFYFNNTQYNSEQDFYADWYYNPDLGTWLSVDQNLNVTVPGNSSSFTYNPTEARFYFEGTLSTAVLAMEADAISFLGVSPGLTIRTSSLGTYVKVVLPNLETYSPDYSFTYSAGEMVAKFQSLPDGAIFQRLSNWGINAPSPFYRYKASNTEMMLDETVGWAPSNLFAAPMTTVYVESWNSGTVTFTFQGITPVYSEGYYAETLNYTNESSGGTLTMHRSLTFNGTVASFAGDISGNSNETGYFAGTLDPNAWNVTGLTGMVNQIGFNSPPGQPSYGPQAVTWDAHFVNYSYTDNAGADHYTDGVSTIVIERTNVVTTAGLYAASGTYDPATQTFNFGGDANMKSFFALNADGNPIGLPVGQVLYFGYPWTGSSIMLTNNQSAPTVAADCVFRCASGYGVCYVGLPSGFWFLVADATGNYDSQIYVTADNPSPIYAAGGWPQSNAFPTHLYVNGIACPLQWSGNSVGGPGQTYGSAPYVSSDGATSVVLRWSWVDGQVSWSWSGNSGSWVGYSGGWDGGDGFGDLPGGLVISLHPLAPSTGPASLTWNGASLTFNTLASDAQLADVYTGSYNGTAIRVVIHPDGSVQVYVGNSSSPSFAGTYNAASQLFNLGDANFGTVASVNGSNNVTGTTTSTGNLDIPGNILSLGNWQNSAGNSVSGFILTFSPPYTSGQDALLRFGSTVSLTDWMWSHAVTDGSSAHRTSMKLDSANRLMLFAPNDDTAPKVIFDPVNGSGVRGAFRVNKQGDVSMGSFQSGPTPP
jgi:hypothetical protein